ncbi:MAG: hypothetical protein UX13_C0026G0020 [Candidatus Woesebacteria bacterium GW2011_GWB1_45_5]|uniref:Uncharacterized protein n=1 Tax=Candidatus Woesebacteria bacterium GW2011_GWB1_45_5 TaxID=1618581 RepID=A0A0G1MNZ3_9BACT|nr:MAG: hypothetical protein UX13_C0026G0020 [Candidatus Woesebacteria bacterium GW2011_GWB1_45_5]
MKLKFFLFLLSLIATRYMLFPVPVSAHCPLCVAGAAAGVTLTRWVGVDDSITGIWIAALLGATAFWLEMFLVRKLKSVKKEILRPILYVFVIGTTLWSFYKFNLIIRMSQIFGLDKLTFGIVSGGILFYLVDAVDDALIKKNGKVLFPYQRIIVSLGSMIVLSLAIYILINYYI